MALGEPVAAHADFLAEWMASPVPVDPAFARFAAREIAATPLAVWHAIPRELVEVPAGRFAPDVTAPIAILSGGKDAIFPAEHHASLVAAYPGASARIFPALGHNLVYEGPDAVGPELAAFLRKVAAGAGARR
jgi:pimeloyl-ACP methyl ester carboxylesterase